MNLQFLKVIVKRIIVQRWEIQKFANRHIKRQGNFVKCLYPRIF